MALTVQPSAHSFDTEWGRPCGGACVQVLEASLEPGQPLRLRQAGMQFAVWVFQQAPARQLLPRAPAVLARLLSLLQGVLAAFSLPCCTPCQSSWSKLQTECA